MITERSEEQEGSIDRSPPIAMFLSGESFLLSARYLKEATETKVFHLRFDMPIYYLYSHALELTLKAFLRSKGYSLERLASREFGHKLQLLWDECLRAGLKCHPVRQALISQTIALLDPFAANFEFRYVKTGLKTLPTLDAIESAANDLSSAIRPYCEATVRQHR